VACDRHLGVSLPESDWVMAGMDLTLLVIGLVFALMAYKVQRRLSRSEVSERAASSLNLQAAERSGA
jgi:hypothetical protein